MQNGIEAEDIGKACGIQTVIETPEENGDCLSQGRPKWLGPKRRWWLLVLWVGLLLAVLVVQWETVFSFDHGHWTPDGFTDPTSEELLWYRLPLVAIILIAVVFFVGLRWWSPEKGTRGMLRAWGFFFSFLSILVSIGISLWYSILYFYMD